MYHVQVNSAGGYLFDVQAKGGALKADMRGVSGITPPDLLLASLGTCLGVYLQKYAEGARLTLKEFSIAVTADFAQEAPVCFRKISVNIDLKGLKLDTRRQSALSEFIKNCPVHNTLKNNPEIGVNIT